MTRRIRPCLRFPPRHLNLQVLFRGVLYATLRSRLGVGWAAVLSSVMFAFTHFYSFAGFVSVFSFGLGAALVYERTRSLPACIIGHSLTNIIIFSTQVLWYG